ncbi:MULTISPECIES: cytochrome C assembly family protein [Achromobacter]|uniref:Cytochrome c biogenesis protein CcsA n=1 Tax=Achromobacter aegrifaciens TaxID=1287736 RepID=A0ABU2DFX1_ACHAE|nr:MULTISPECIES: cytochrome c biogenesis protein CcsA [Achromobacter]MBD9382719.1 cytochrome c biogenesis protein CcsA [Achromobacter sp. ACM02]MBD9420685.1 cytochrome c biogenesis protein CcsA [Achromobacter sp. ACM04]MBD9430455.1 cytochrome c biogenesis protein CcsA [Achromobacter sp. ACM03]MBD9471987.1 cytochrome c biogenesis protein CcsA [Achromobacter sp. ACM01]MDQ1760762.1 cytochrome c biogenesis protein CcsA [Achromobacter aegrifaciens]
MSLGIVFHTAAALAYAVLGGSLWIRLARGGGVEQTGKIARLCLLGALVLHGIGLQQSMLGAQHLFIGWALALSAAIWLGMVVFWLESLLVRIDGLQLLLLPAATIASGLAAIFPQGQFVPHANDAWLRVHLLIALAAYGLITIAALHAMMMALLDRHLHRPLEAPAERSIVGRVLDSQPPLLVQEQLLFRIIWIGFIVLTLAVGTGSVASMKLTGKILPFDHKTVFTLLSWLTFGVLLAGRHVWGWRGRVALRWTLTGFGFLILAYTGSRFVLEMILHRG